MAAAGDDRDAAADPGLFPSRLVSSLCFSCFSIALLALVPSTPGMWHHGLVRRALLCRSSRCIPVLFCSPLFRYSSTYASECSIRANYVDDCAI
jgi:hypothetical protein